jgi:hypothetical protein
VPSPHPVPPTGPLRGDAATRRRITVLLVVGAACGALTAVLGPAAALLGLALGVAALGAAAALGFRAQWRATAPGTPPVGRAPIPQPDRDDVATRLRELHAAHLAQVDAALDAGRADLFRELSADYADRALRLLTDGVPAGPASPTAVVFQPAPHPRRPAGADRAE